ncbi:hypothetical protein, partial [Pseudoalteromonas sp. SIMBA_162]|uniref:hypothetical protein n=1 Tax=Pseudoalteromonas sp. SIMBA_162 TaxID=3080867 RepID=UPI00397E6983
DDKIDDDGAYKKRMEQRANKNKAIEILHGSDNDGSTDGYKRMKEKLLQVGEYKGREADLKWLDDAIKRAEERDKEEALKQPIKDVLRNYPNMYYATVDELKAMKTDLEALPESD